MSERELKKFFRKKKLTSKIDDAKKDEKEIARKIVDEQSEKVMKKYPDRLTHIFRR